MHIDLVLEFNFMTLCKYSKRIRRIRIQIRILQYSKRVKCPCKLTTCTVPLGNTCVLLEVIATTATLKLTLKHVRLVRGHSQHSHAQVDPETRASC